MDIHPRFARHAMKLIIGGLAMIYYGLSRARENRRKFDFPLSKVRSLSSGKVRVRGTVRSNDPHFSPVEGIECCMSVMSIEQRRLNSWLPMAVYFEAEDWYLEDEQGSKVRVDPERASFEGKALTQVTVYPWTRHQRVEEIVKATGFNTSFFGLPKFYRVSEYVVLQGEEVEIVAEARGVTRGTIERREPGKNVSGEKESWSSLTLTSGPLSGFLVRRPGDPQKRDWIVLLLLSGGGTMLLGGIGLLAGLLNSGLSGAEALVALGAGFFTILSLAYFLGGFHRQDRSQ